MYWRRFRYSTAPHHQLDAKLTHMIGIGLALTKQAHAIGAKVLVADLKTTAAFDTFAEDKDDILYIQCDVTRWAEFTKLFDACEKKWNDVPDAYGICAGIFDPPFSNFWEDPEQDEGYMQVDVNVNHPIKLTRLAIRKSLKRGKRASVCIIVSCPMLCNLRLRSRNFLNAVF
jgi:NAD(P)-dependent dehydrogenase (short-subunit alcohol dehydrogenase family)